MRIYISGPMTGIPEFNFPAFNTAAKSIRANGHIAINPAEKVSEAGALSWAEYMREDIKMLVDCDAIALLPGWENSRGATLELYIATQLAIKVFLFSSLDLRS